MKNTFWNWLATQNSVFGINDLLTSSKSSLNLSMKKLKKRISTLNWLDWITLILIFISITVTIIFFSSISRNYTLEGDLDIAMDATGQVGDFIGGIVGTLLSIIGFILLYRSFATQNKTLRIQQNQFLLQQIEGRFFELLTLHRNNVSEMIYRDGTTKLELASGRQVFKEVYEQLRYANKITAISLSNLDLAHILKQDSLINKRGFTEEMKTQFAISNLAYSVVFLGVTRESIEGLKNILKKDFEDKFVEGYIELMEIIPAKASIFFSKWTLIYEANILEKYFQKFIYSERVFPNKIITLRNAANRGKFYKYFGGHQSKLGHYYRHLFRTVKYVDEQLINYKRKNEYINILRAQLSNYEVFLLFFNSLCFMGREWELNHNDEYGKLISKFSIIRNIPYTVYKYYVAGNEYQIDLKLFYPLVDFEFEPFPKGRIEFIKHIVEMDNNQKNLFN